MRLQKVSFSILFGAFFLWGASILREWALLGPSLASTCNDAALFGLVLLPLPVFLGLSGGLLGLFAWQFIKAEGYWSAFGWLLLFLAGLSNFGERLRFGCVTDYLSLQGLFPWFPQFNVADLGLTLGVIVLFFPCLSLCRPKSSPQPPSVSKASTSK